MRSTLDLPESLVAAAKELTGLPTKQQAVLRALEESVRRWRLERFAEQLGHIDFDLTAEELERMRADG